MTMDNRKMNNYSLMRISTVFVLAVALVTSTFAIPFLPRTGAVSLTPPDTPYNPDPSNRSVDISVYTVLSWNCSDPDNDTIAYDIFLGITSPPEKLASDVNTSSYDPEDLTYSQKYYWQVVAKDINNESTSGPIWEFTTKTDSAPNMPENETPDNDSSNVLLNAILRWECSDPDGDTLTYDVYLGTTSNPGKVASNQSSASYDPQIAYNTTYYWRIVAWDSNKMSKAGPLWHFKTTTGQQTPFSVVIEKPTQGVFYFNDVAKMTFSGNNTIVYGKITIVANVSSLNNISYVEFLVDGKPIKGGNLTSEPWSVEWRPIIQFNSALSLKRTITVIAHDSEGKNASANITVTKWRFHPLPWIIAGLSLASRLILHTTVVGVFYNVQQSRFSVSFYAIQAHYKTVGPLQMRKGNIHFKHCTGGIMIGPSTLTRIGLMHKFAIGSFTFIGNVNMEKTGFGGLLLSRILSRRAG